MGISENCEKHIKSLQEFNNDVATRYMTRRITFNNRDDTPFTFSLGFVETISQNDNMSVYSEEEMSDERFETLEAQLREVPRKFTNVVKKSRMGTGSAPLKLHSKASRYKSIVEPRKMSQPFRIVGSEGEENAEFKHPLGKEFILLNMKYFIVLKKPVKKRCGCVANRRQYIRCGQLEQSSASIRREWRVCACY